MGKTLQNSLNKKDIRINELFEETIKKEQMKVVELRQQIMRLRSESSRLIFDKKALPQIPGQSPPIQNEKQQQNLINIQPSMNRKRSTSVPVTQNVSIAIPEQMEISQNIKSKQTNVNNENVQAVESESVSKETKKNALNALFGAKKNEKKTDLKIESAENPALKKYFRMRKIGMPMVSI